MAGEPSIAFVIKYLWLADDEEAAVAVVNGHDAEDAERRFRAWNGEGEPPVRVLSVEPLGDRVILAEADQYDLDVPTPVQEADR